MRSASAAMVALLSEQVAELDLHSELLVQRGRRLCESKRVEPQLDKRHSRIEALRLQSGQIGEQLTKARDMRP